MGSRETTTPCTEFLSTAARSGALLALAALAIIAFSGCKDHATQEVERTGAPAPNQRVPTPSGTYQ